ncbi:hypothetical protein BC833DRAFT_638023 [Globomyces pollinis-pini]|nr:hypothetical protein BC833DRAFT_638023 [Globomyces pollinis-pini]
MFGYEESSLELQRFKPPMVKNRNGISYLLYNITRNDDGEHCKVCDDCVKDINEERLPLYSIPNYCFPEHQPDILKDLSIAESLFISKIYPRSIIYQHQMHSKGGHSYIKGHCLSFENDLSNLVTILPRTVNDVNQLLRVVFVGSNSNPRIKG